MKYLRNHITNELKPVSNMHPDALKTLDNREEPLVAAQAVDQERMLKAVDDPTTDPEGAERRADTAEAYPFWVLEEYRPSKSTYWGKPNPDGKEHLIPKESLVKAVIQTHINGEATLGKMIELAHGATNAVSFKALTESYEFMFMTADKSYLYSIMNSLSGITRAAFADRAFTKYSFLSALQRQKPDVVDLPEYMDFLKERMLQSATMCGTWASIHSKMWTLMEYKNSPTYVVDNEIRMKLVQNAKFLESRNKPIEAPRPTQEDQRSLAAMC